MNNVFDILTERGFVAQFSDPCLRDRLGAERLTVYTGFDPTADSLHVGHLVPIMAMVHFQRHGHRPLILVGGATGMVGDPSGRYKERNLLTADQVAANAAAIKAQLSRFLRFGGDDGALMLDNHDWVGRMSFLDWLRDVGKYFTVNFMLAKESVSSRIASENGISLTEFCYMTVQAYDFLHLFETYGCTLQCGGNDQWGNITAGIDLIRKVHGAVAYGLTFPVLERDGEKIGKSAGKPIWLDAKRTSVYRFYQYWIHTDDVDVKSLLSLFSLLSFDEVEAIVRKHQAAPERRDGQKTLAAEVTRMVHGEQGLERALRATNALFGKKLDEAELLAVIDDVPSSTVTRARLNQGIPLLDLFVEVDLAESRGEVRRAIRNRGICINNVRIADDENRCVTAADVLERSLIVLRKGKSTCHLVKVLD